MHPENDFFPSVVTDDGIRIFLRFLQSIKQLGTISILGNDNK